MGRAGEGTPVWEPDAAQADGPRARAIAAAGLHGLVAVPVQAEDETLAVLEMLPLPRR